MLPRVGAGGSVASATVAQVENSFRTELHRYEARGRMHFGPASEVEVPAELRSLVGSIRGLDNFRWEPQGRWRPMYTASDGTHALAPGDLANVYGISHLYAVGPRGTGQRIAVAGPVGNRARRHPPIPLYFRIAGGARRKWSWWERDPGIDASGPLQEATPISNGRERSPPSAQVVYVYAADVVDAVLHAIDQNLAPVLSLSYGGCEGDLNANVAQVLQAVAQQANAQGITWVAASGDWGAAGCGRNSAGDPGGSQ